LSSFCISLWDFDIRVLQTDMKAPTLQVLIDWMVRPIKTKEKALTYLLQSASLVLP
jgi:hypothetical protein